METCPVLWSLARYYFDQDYDMRGNTINEVIAYFKQDNTVDVSEELASELKLFLSSRSTDDDATLTQEFKELFKPDIAFYRWGGKTTRENLEEILNLVEDRSACAQP